jgi:hypothetical protein
MEQPRGIELRSNSGSLQEQITTLQMRKWWSEQVTKEKARGLSIADANLYRQNQEQEKRKSFEDTLVTAMFVVIGISVVFVGGFILGVI